VPSGAGVLSYALLLLIFNPATFQYPKFVTCRPNSLLRLLSLF